MDKYDLKLPVGLGIEVQVRLVITWRKDPKTGKAPQYYNCERGNQTTYFMLHQFVSERYQVPLEYLIVRRNGWMEVESLYVWILQARILTLYYSMNETWGGPSARLRYFTEK